MWAPVRSPTAPLISLPPARRGHRARSELIRSAGQAEAFFADAKCASSFALRGTKGDAPAVRGARPVAIAGGYSCLPVPDPAWTNLCEFGVQIPRSVCLSASLFIHSQIHGDNQFLFA